MDVNLLCYFQVSVSSQTQEKRRDITETSRISPVNDKLELVVKDLLNSLSTLREYFLQLSYIELQEFEKSMPEGLEKESTNIKLQLENEISSAFANIQKLKELQVEFSFSNFKINENEPGSIGDILFFMKNEVANLNKKLLESEKINTNLRLKLNQAEIVNKDMSTMHQQLDKSRALNSTLKHQLEVAEMKAINEESLVASHAHEILAAKQQLHENDKIIKSLREDNKALLESNLAAKAPDNNIGND